MLDDEDLKWMASTSTELNTILQQISRYADLARQHKGEYRYIDLLVERVEFASKAGQSLFDRITSRILAGSLSKTGESLRPASSPSKSSGVSGKMKRASQKASANSKVDPPAATAATLTPSSIPAGIKVFNEKGNRELILIVDDEIDVAEVASAILTDEGYRVVIAHDGFEALKIYQQISKHVALVILDFFLPVMDGDAVFDELRALNPKVVAVLSSGFAEQNKLNRMLELGLAGFIPKPYNREKLLEQVRSTLDIAHQTGRRS